MAKRLSPLCHEVTTSMGVRLIQAKEIARSSGLTNSKNGAIVASNRRARIFLCCVWMIQMEEISSQDFGGKNKDAGIAVITADDGYIAVGNTNSSNGIVSGNHGGSICGL